MTRQEALEKAEKYLAKADQVGMPSEMRAANAHLAQAYIALAAQLSDEPVLTGQQKERPPRRTALSTKIY